MAKNSMSPSKIAIWVLLALLIAGLAGFGTTNLSGNIRTIGAVGDKSISVDRYANALQDELRVLNRQNGSPISFAQAQSFGFDQAVLARLMRSRALDHEATQIGVSVGDETLREELLQIPAFRGPDGQFSRDAYRLALQNTRESEFEEQIREEMARGLLQIAVQSGTDMPDIYAQTMIGFMRETRDISWARLTEDDLAQDIAVPSEEVLRLYHSENASQFLLPETKIITYAILTPDMILDEVDVADTQLQEAYDDQFESFNLPERRLVERLVYADEASADRAIAQLEVGGTTFEVLTADRGLTLGDIDLGDVTLEDLGDAGEAVFAAEVGAVLGPLPSTLGPALYRINAVLAAQSTSFEEARPILQEQLAADASRRQVAALAEQFDFELGAGSTLEELAESTQMELGRIEWSTDLTDDVAAYEAFRQNAATITKSDFPEIFDLGDGGVMAMRLDEEIASRPLEFDEAKSAAQDAWQRDAVLEALTAQAETVSAQLSSGQSFEELGLTAMIEEGANRTSFIGGAPLDLLFEAFRAELGETVLVQDERSVVIGRVDAIVPLQIDDTVRDEIDAVSAEFGQLLGGELMTVFSEDALDRAGPQIDQRAVEAVHVNFQ